MEKAKAKDLIIGKVYYFDNTETSRGIFIGFRNDGIKDIISFKCLRNKSGYAETNGCVEFPFNDYEYIIVNDN